MEEGEYTNWHDPTERLRRGGEFVAGRELFDYIEIEHRVSDLIDQHSQEVHLEMDDEPFDNARTALFEELTASGDLSVIEFYGDQHDVHKKTLARLLNGWNENAPWWEKHRRFREICEEMIVYEAWCLVEAGELPEDTVINTMSDCPEDATPEEAIDIGYRLLNRKGFARTHTFYKTEDGQWVRVLEQVSRSNSNDGSSQKLFASRGLGDYNIADSTDVLGMQAFSTRRDQPDLAVDLARWLDEQIGPDILYGEQRAFAKRDGRPDYENLRRVSAERRDQLNDHIQELADYEAELQKLHHSGQIDYDEKLWRYRQKQTEVVERILILVPEYVVDARGAAAADEYDKARMAYLCGDEQAFIYHHQEARKLADPGAPGVCGGIGSTSDEFGPKQSEGVFGKLAEDSENWPWKEGICVVRTCRKKTKVGPCSVCKKCQRIFNLGIDPGKIGKAVELNNRNSSVETSNVIELGSRRKNVDKPKSTGFVIANAA